MNQKIFQLLFLSIFFTFLSETNAQSATLSSGGEATSSSGTTSFSIGQVAYTSITGSAGSVESGVQQSYSISTSFGFDLKTIQLELSAYPNPVQQTLSLKVENFNQQSLRYFLFNLNGKLLDQKQISDAMTNIQVEHLPKATYILKIEGNNEIVKSFNIIKL